MDAVSPTVMGLDDLDVAVTTNLDRIPTRLRAVAALSGSDLMAAALVALYRQLPLAMDAGGQARGGGQRLQSHTERVRERLEAPTLIMLTTVEDRAALVDVRRLQSEQRDRPLLLGAVFATGDVADELDIVLERTAAPTLMAWELPHRKELERSGVALEGVLAAPTRRPWNWSANGVEPLLRPSHRIRSIVSSRPDSHRRDVTAWLDRHGIAYDHLVMRPTRTFVFGGLRTFAAFKADHYRSQGVSIHIEPDVASARRLAAATNEPAVAWRQQRTVLARRSDAATEAG